MRKSILIISSVLFLAASVSLNALMFSNESCVAFPEGCSPGGGKRVGITIGSLITEGGCFFLKSNSDTTLFLSLIESSESTGPDYNALQSAINSAVFNMEQAKETYYQLKTLAAVTPYNQEVIQKLIQLDYTGLQKTNRLIPAIFDRVAELLGEGDVKGIYSECYLYLTELLEILNTVKKDIESNTFPNLSTLWRLNQKFAEVKLFGQYVTEVFYSLK